MVVGLFANYFAGKIAEVAVWNVALGDDEIASLAAGANPTTIEAEYLVGYWPLLSDANDDIGSNNLTLQPHPGEPSFDSEDHPTIETSYIELSATLSGSGSVSGTLTLSDLIELTATLSGAGSVSGALVLGGGMVVDLYAHKHLVVAGYDAIWLED
jgi:hypothetical protein